MRSTIGMLLVYAAGAIGGFLLGRGYFNLSASRWLGPWLMAVGLLLAGAGLLTGYKDSTPDSGPLDRAQIRRDWDWIVENCESASIGSDGAFCYKRFPPCEQYASEKCPVPRCWIRADANGDVGCYTPPAAQPYLAWLSDTQGPRDGEERCYVFSEPRGEWLPVTGKP